MTEINQKLAAEIELIPAAREQAPILANLLELYIHDFSELLDAQLGSDGRFGYPRLPLYWIEPGRHPFLVKIDGRWAGFALVKQGSEVSGNRGVWDVAEFFVLRRYRRQGIGTHIAKELWSRFPGQWEVRVMQSNIAALIFWERAIVSFTGDAVHPVSYEKAGESWELFSFDSSAGRE